MKEETQKIEEIKNRMRKHAEENGFKVNPNEEVLTGLIKGLLANEKKYGARYCPCRVVTGDAEEDKKKICPCFWHKEEIERDGHCHCEMFYKK